MPSNCFVLTEPESAILNGGQQLAGASAGNILHGLGAQGKASDFTQEALAWQYLLESPDNRISHLLSS